MEQIISCLIFMLFVVGKVSSNPIEKSQPAFDPNTLMERYMNMRTDQDMFGSFHPNDLINTITEYFKNGGDHRKQDNLWGLSIYNPNENMKQYMSRLDEPGTLGPRMNGVSAGIQQLNQKVNGFNPSALNQKLMQPTNRNSLITSEPDNIKQSANDIKLGFNADAINRKLLQDVVSGSAQIVPLSNHKSSTTDTLNPTATDKNNVKTDGTANGMSIGVLFNPDQVNAKLFSSIKYKPGSAVTDVFTGQGSKSQQASTYSTNTSQQAIPKNTSTVVPGTQKITTAIHGHTSVNQAGGNGGTGKSFVNPGGARSNNLIDNTLHETGSTNQGPTLTGLGGAGSIVYSQTNGLVQTTASAGDLGGSMSRGAVVNNAMDKDQVLPPGLLSNMNLKQTHAKAATVNGIGSMG